MANNKLKVLLIRHGESIGNKLGVHQGQRKNFELSDKGKEQARKLAQKLKKEKIGIIYSSDLIRARQTAEEIAKLSNLKINEEKDLREFSYGLFEEGDLSFIEVQKKFEEFSKGELAKGKSKRDIKPTGGESMNELTDRLQKFMKKIENHKGTIAIFSHGGPIRALIRIAKGLERENIDNSELEESKIEQTSISTLEFDGKKWKIVKLNDLEHLK